MSENNLNIPGSESNYLAEWVCVYILSTWKCKWNSEYEPQLPWKLRPIIKRCTQGRKHTSFYCGLYGFLLLFQSNDRMFFVNGIDNKFRHRLNTLRQGKTKKENAV